MQVLLDHQLMDMAWSDNLIDCEENLLKVSNVLQQSPNSAATTQQMAELYGILIHDRDKLNHRFQELSIKSSLSEFVVNSRQLLDINAVRIAAEAILKNEKPIPAQGDHSSKIMRRTLSVKPKKVTKRETYCHASFLRQSILEQSSSVEFREKVDLTEFL